MGVVAEVTVLDLPQHAPAEHTFISLNPLRVPF